MGASDAPRGGRFTKNGVPGPGRPKGSKAKIPVEWRQGLREHFLEPKTFALLLTRIDKDLRSVRHAPTLALKMAAHAFGEPPQDVNLNAGNSLRDALLAAFDRKTKPEDGDKPK
jgi:hypothetical protein